jgi:DNA repair protein RadC
MRYRFATIDLRWQERGGTVDDLPELLEKEGMFSAIQEVLWVIAFGGQTDLHAVVEVARGDFYEVRIHIPIILQAVLASGTDRFWLLHNHPAGGVKPTDRDIEATKQVMAAANQADMYLEDHLIVAPPGRIYSMKDHGQLVPARRIEQLIAADRAER